MKGGERGGGRLRKYNDGRKYKIIKLTKRKKKKRGKGGMGKRRGEKRQLWNRSEEEERTGKEWKEKVIIDDKERKDKRGGKEGRGKERGREKKLEPEEQKKIKD